MSASIMSGEEKKPACSVFKRTQARYRRRPETPDHVDDLDEMIDFQNTAPLNDDERIVSIQVASWSCGDADAHEYYTGKMYGLKAYPGFLYAPAALSPDLQTALAFSAVSTYCEVPHTTNIDAVPPKPNETANSYYSSMWDNWKAERESTPVLGQQQRQQQQQQSPVVPKKHHYRRFGKLTWATLGYHYDWTARAYHEGAKSPMPDALTRLGQLFGRTALRVQLNASPAVTNPAFTTNDSYEMLSYEATACIVNYYNSKSVMGGHRDDLEVAVTKPIVSVSLGCPAVFLLGGKTVDCEPVFPMIARPGDVMIMGGDCRLNYHSMARLLPAKLPTPPPPLKATTTAAAAVAQHQVKLEDLFSKDEASQMCAILEDSRELDALDDFLSNHRVNINLRQVYNTTL
jgi:alkylated DNA repair dioxygenase AlkB